MNRQENFDMVNGFLIKQEAKKARILLESLLENDIPRSRFEPTRLTRADFDQPDVEAADENVPTYCGKCGMHMSGPDLGPMKQAMEKYDHISHGLCPHCEEEYNKEIEAYYS